MKITPILSKQADFSYFFANFEKKLLIFTARAIA